YAGEYVAPCNLASINVFLMGITLLRGNSWRKKVVKDLKDRFAQWISMKTVNIFIPEPRDPQCDNWGKFYKIQNANYNQIAWEAFYIKKCQVRTMWLPCFMTKEESGPAFA